MELLSFALHKGKDYTLQFHHIEEPKVSKFFRCTCIIRFSAFAMVLPLLYFSIRSHKMFTSHPHATSVRLLLGIVMHLCCAHIYRHFANVCTHMCLVAGHSVCTDSHTHILYRICEYVTQCSYMKGLAVNGAMTGWFVVFVKGSRNICWFRSLQSDG